MKLADVMKVVAPFLAADKKPEDVRAAVLAADKKAKDAAGSGLGARELEEKDQPKAQDAKAMDEREAACDEREEALDAAEEKADKDKDDKDAKDRKAARDSRRGARDARKGARDARMSKDRDDDPEHTNDEDVSAGDPSTPGGNRGGKQAVDSAEVDRRIKAAVDATRAEGQALHTALREVEPILGVVAFDSAPKAYRAALDHMKVDTKDVPDSALPAMLRLAKDRAQAPTVPAMDSASVKNVEQIIPGYGRLR